MVQSFADAFSTIIRWIINLAPFGIAGLMFGTVSEVGIEALQDYGNNQIV